MKTSHWIALALLLTGFGSALVSTARQTSLVYDEVIYAPAGVLYWKTGDFRWNSVHPPLQKLISALPLLGQDLAVPSELDPTTENEWRMGYRVFFQSPTPATKLIFLARLPTIVVSLLLALLIFLWCARHSIQLGAAIVATSVFVLDPLVLGNGGLAMNDMFVTLFVFAAAWAFDEMLAHPSPWLVIASGTLAGAAVACKLSGLLLGPVFLFMVLRKNKKVLVLWKHIIGTAAAAAFVFFACYGFKISYAAQTLLVEWGMHAVGRNQGFLLRPIAGHSTWYYYPVAMFVKTPAPLLALWIAGLFLLFKTKANKTIFFAGVPILVFGLAAMLSRNHFGVRYLLPAVPFAALIVGEAFRTLAEKKERWVFVVLITWLAANTAMAHPHHMAYFNSLIGGSKNGYQWLDGSNQDWGQDLPTLAALANSQNPKPALCLGYWGSNRPEAWGLEYQDVYSPAITNTFREDRVNPVDVEREWLVVSASLRMNPSIKGAYRWLKDKEPIAFLGHTLFVYDITDDPYSIKAIGHIYKSMNRMAMADRQYQRADLVKNRQK